MNRPHRFRPLRWFAVAILVLTPAVVLATRVQAVNLAIRECGAPKDARVQAAFELPAAKQYREHFPRIPTLPELEGSNVPAFVVVMDGPVVIPHLGPAGAPEEPPAASVVCVLVDHVPHIYPNLDLTDFRP